MILEVAARAPVGLLPVVAFLAALMYFDSYKLVGLRIVVATIFVGAAAAGLCYVINDAALHRLSVDFITYSRYVSPVIEETIKALTIVYLIRSQRIAFLVDAAIYGFAVGTGFAVVENLYYLSHRDRTRSCRCGSCVASARRSCTAAPRRSSRSSRWR